MKTLAPPDAVGRPVAGEGLMHPLAVVAIAVLVLNDHWGKAHFPGFVTGKLSDFAGLFFFPLVVQALWEGAQSLLGRAWRPSVQVLIVAAVATAVVFAAVKVWPPATEAYRLGFGALRWPLDAAVASLFAGPLPALARVSLAADPTDLVALPMVLGALWTARRRSAQGEALAPVAVKRR